MAHMEKFGEVFDHSVKADDDGLITAVFPFRKTGDALKVSFQFKRDSILNKMLIFRQWRMAKF